MEAIGRAGELATTTVLEILLEQQLRSLASLSAQAERAIRMRQSEPVPAHWTGATRDAYDGAVRTLDSTLEHAAASLKEAMVQTGRALATVNHRVG